MYHVAALGELLIGQLGALVEYASEVGYIDIGFKLFGRCEPFDVL
jgi:hypothetical protein